MTLDEALAVHVYLRDSEMLAWNLEIYNEAHDLIRSCAEHVMERRANAKTVLARQQSERTE